MNAISRLLKKLQVFFGRQNFDRELQEEMAFHLEQKAQTLQSRGLSEEDARYAARREFGNDTHLSERSRDVVGLWFESTVQDFRFALRQLRKNPGFAFTAVFMLALGLCASVSIFAFVDATLIKPLPYQNPQRLVGVYEATPQCPLCNLSYPDYLDYKKMNKSFASLDVYQKNSMMLQPN